MSELEAFRSDVEAFLAQHQITPTRFGRDAANDAMFVFQLRSGREPRSTTREKVRQFMAEGQSSAKVAA